jgi:deoxyribonuclease IV
MEGKASAVPAPRLGAHLNGGVKGAAEHARRMGLDGSLADGAGGPIQIWSRNPSAWRSGAHEAKVVDAFRAACATYHLGPVFVHGIYLMNFASPDDALWERSIEAMVDQLQTGAALGAGAVILHPGAGKDQSLEVALDRCALALRRVLEQTAALPQRPLIALETCAGAGTALGRTFGELRGLLDRLDGDPGIAFCLDTAHLWGSGYDLATEEGLRATTAEMEGTIPVQRIVAVHANDSKVPLGSHKDRHENIGQGYIGEEAFGRMLAHPLWRGLPWVMEVPGYDNSGPDAQNLETLRRLAGP